MINGFIGNSFNIEQSVKQGDALSCALFIIAIEPLLRQISKNNKIEGVTLTRNKTGESAHINNMSFADDITAICNNQEGIQAVIDEYTKFSKYSGIKLNVKKTEILIINKKGNNKVQFTITQGKESYIITDVDNVKICGITFSNNKETAYNENVINKISKLERQLNLWRQRNLTLKGKILIVKTFAISQLIYSMQATHIRDKELKTIENIILRFIWNTKSSTDRVIGKIAKHTLKKGITEGGLNAPDITLINSALKYKHILRCQHSTHPVNIITNEILDKYKLNWNDLTTSSVNEETYIATSIKTSNKLIQLLTTDIKIMASETDGIHMNYLSYVQNIQINKTSLFPSAMSNVVKRLNRFNIFTLHDLCREHKAPTTNNIVIDVRLAFTKLPKEFQCLLKKAKKYHSDLSITVKLNKWKLISNITTRDIYLRLISDNTGKDDMFIYNFLNNKHKLNITTNSHSNPFAIIKTITKDVRLQNIQYKLLHNIYPTMNHLYKWKIKDNPLCKTCNKTDDLYHTIFECPFAKQTLDNFSNILKERLALSINITYEDLLLSYTANLQNKIINKNQKIIIDKMLIIIKRALILQRDDKRIINKQEMDDLIMYQYQIEYNNAKSIIDKSKIVRLWCEITQGIMSSFSSICK